VMFNVADQIGAEASSGVSPVLKNAGFEIGGEQELSARRVRPHQ